MEHDNFRFLGLTPLVERDLILPDIASLSMEVERLKQNIVSWKNEIYGLQLELSDLGKLLCR